ncbi:DUF4956 domain-containing protein [Maribacter algarum]|uniref:DUF4956 domain-containing protein n=1 Tax=Maribacter algarum (ex Zhang et al. 2020) TaxID=2578118 RepID=A0A5S3PXI7_9FLAO|nr:DUF4956 domain-containing protein [Maribacter algarum]TMM58942.1 DUF4956 domain-containing protein [Maribacter algarum]
MNEFNDLLSQFNTENISIVDFLINLLLTLITAYLLSFVYSRYGASLSNRNKLAQTLVLLSITTMIIITIVKSSLALSLGLVGALSIVRFRTAIKEPEELAYFFIAISIGLGFGADQKTITLVGVLFVLLFVIITGASNKKKHAQQNLILSIAGGSGKVNETEIINTLKEFCSQVDIKRIDQSNEMAELSLNVEFKTVEGLIQAKEALSKLGEMEFSFIERH